MKNLFVDYQIALQLKEKKFDEECLAFYFDGKFQTDGIFQQYPERCVNAPLYQQIIDWLREKHKIHVWVTSNIHDLGNFPIFYWYHVHTSKVRIERGDVSYKIYYEALNKAIQEAIKLI